MDLFNHSEKFGVSFFNASGEKLDYASFIKGVKSEPTNGSPSALALAHSQGPISVDINKCFPIMGVLDLSDDIRQVFYKKTEVANSPFVKRHVDDCTEKYNKAVRFIKKWDKYTDYILQCLSDEYVNKCREESNKTRTEAEEFLNSLSVDWDNDNLFSLDCDTHFKGEVNNYSNSYFVYNKLKKAYFRNYAVCSRVDDKSSNENAFKDFAKKEGILDHVISHYSEPYIDALAALNNQYNEKLILKKELDSLYSSWGDGVLLEQGNSIYSISKKDRTEFLSNLSDDRKKEEKNLLDKIKKVTIDYSPLFKIRNEFHKYIKGIGVDKFEDSKKKVDARLLLDSDNKNLQECSNVLAGILESGRSRASFIEMKDELRNHYSNYSSLTLELKEFFKNIKYENYYAFDNYDDCYNHLSTMINNRIQRDIKLDAKELPTKEVPKPPKLNKKMEELISSLDDEVEAGVVASGHVKSTPKVRYTSDLFQSYTLCATGTPTSKYFKARTKNDLDEKNKRYLKRELGILNEVDFVKNLEICYTDGANGEFCEKNPLKKANCQPGTSIFDNFCKTHEVRITKFVGDKTTRRGHNDGKYIMYLKFPYSDRDKQFTLTNKLQEEDKNYGSLWALMGPLSRNDIKKYFVVSDEYMDDLDNYCENYKGKKPKDVLEMDYISPPQYKEDEAALWRSHIGITSIKLNLDKDGCGKIVLGMKYEVRQPNVNPSSPESIVWGVDLNQKECYVVANNTNGYYITIQERDNISKKLSSLREEVDFLKCIRDTGRFPVVVQKDKTKSLDVEAYHGFKHILKNIQSLRDECDKNSLYYKNNSYLFDDYDFLDSCFKAIDEDRDILKGEDALYVRGRLDRIISGKSAKSVRIKDDFEKKSSFAIYTIMNELGCKCVNIEDLNTSKMIENNDKKSGTNKQKNTSNKNQLSARMSKRRDLLKHMSRMYQVLCSMVNPSYTSKRCFDCKVVNDEIIKGVKEWTCNSCGVWHNRDVNAARNIAASHPVKGK